MEIIKRAFVTGGSGFVGRNLLESLVKEGWKVKALARSKESSNIVEKLGAEVIFGDISDYPALLKGCAETHVVYHLAAKVDLEGPWNEFQKATIEGTQNTLKAAKESKVSKFILCSTEAVLVGGQNLVNADETWPYPSSPLGFYPLSKGQAERDTLKANDPKSGFSTIIVRPRLIWGRGDTVLGPKIAEAVKTGKWKWIGGGIHKSSSCHVRNVVEGLMKAAQNGRAGENLFCDRWTTFGIQSIHD